MAKKREKILTRRRVYKLGLDNVSVITADMLDGYTKIGYRAFYECTSLTSITIPNSVTSIGHEAFLYCSSLVSVTIGNSVTSIGRGAFYRCHNLKNIVIPNSVTSIGDLAFYKCTGLTSITIPNSVTSIGYIAFYECSSLKSIIIGDKEYKNHKVVNSKCKAYKGFNSNMTCRDFQYKKGKTYEFDGEPKLCECGFHACLKLSDVFDYYSGRIGKEIVVCEVELEGVVRESDDNSKVVAKKITIGKRIL